MKTISVVIPCFNEELNIENSYQKVKDIFKKISGYKVEIIFVDNCSSDSSPQIMRKIAKRDKGVMVIFLSRNFGGEYSSLAGMKHATGDATCVLDCDLQDPPELILDFIKKWEEGYKVVVGCRKDISDGFFMKPLRKIFYKLLNKISNLEIPVNAGTYSLIDRSVMDVINSLPEKNRFFRGLRAWAGFGVAKVEYKRTKRRFGNSKNTFIDYLRDAERGYFGFSFVPLEVVTYLGFFLVVVSFLFISVYIILSLFLGNPIPGFMTIISLVTFLGGVQILATSVVGKYVQIIFEETKNRPPYIVSEIVNFHKRKIS